METILHDFNQNVTTLVEEFLENAIVLIAKVNAPPKRKNVAFTLTN